MPGIIPTLAQGALTVRDSGGVCLAPAGVSNDYCPPALFTSSCDILYLPDDCTARITAAQINGFQSEMLCLAATMNPNGNWNCDSLCNLSAAFIGYVTETGPSTLWRQVQTHLCSMPALTGDVFAALPNGSFITCDGSGNNRRLTLDALALALCEDASSLESLQNCITENNYYATRAAAVTALSNGLIILREKKVYVFGGLQYVRVASSDIISDLPGFEPSGIYTAAHWGLSYGTFDITVGPIGKRFSTPEQVLNFAYKFSIEEPLTVTQTGTIIGNISLQRSLQNVIWRAETSRASLAIANFTATATPLWNTDPNNNNSDPTTNILHLANRASIGAMLRGRYSAVIECLTGNGIELNGNDFGQFRDILFIATSTIAQRGLSTGGSIKTGAGGQTDLFNCSIHGFMASGISCNYGGTVNAYDSTSSVSTVSCCGDSGVNLQYAGSSVYAAGCISYANFNWGGRCKQFGLFYPGDGFIMYNRLDGLSATGGGRFNALGATITNNGGYGVNLTGSGANAELANAALTATISNNGNGGISLRQQASVSAQGITCNNNGGAGVYIIGGGSAAVENSTFDGNVSHNLWVQDGGTITADGAIASNAVNGLGVRIDRSGYVNIRNGSIFGNSNAFGKQILVSQNGTVNCTLATTTGGAPISDVQTTPPRNSLTAQGSLIVDSASNSVIRVLREDYVQTVVANGPAFTQNSPSSTVPTILIDRTALTSGIGRNNSAAETALIEAGVLTFGAGPGYVRFPTEIRQGGAPGTGVRVLGPRVTGHVAATGTASSGTFVTSTVTLVQLAEQVKALKDALLAHGIIGT